MPEDKKEKMEVTEKAPEKKAPAKKKLIPPPPVEEEKEEKKAPPPPPEKKGAKEEKKTPPPPPEEEEKKKETKAGLKKKPAPKKVEEKKEEKPAVVKKPAPKKAEKKEEKEPEEEEVEIIEKEEKGYSPKLKPKIGSDLKRDLSVRRTIKGKTPHFKQQEWFRYKRINESWRRPRGLHSKMRKHMGYRPNVVSIGYGSPSKARGLHPSGFQEILVYNTDDLKKIDPKRQAARVGHSVGTRKRIEIEAEAEKKGIRVLNPRR